MSSLLIRTGLRKLDFGKPATGPTSEGTSHVIVEFAVNDRLARDQVVKINLGIRAGIERTLQGLPTLVKAAADKKGEFLYRLEGDLP